MSPALDIDETVAVLMQICDCSACERLRRAERRKDIAPLYRARLELQLRRPK